MVVEPTALIVLPDLVSPVPAVICPAPENCANDKAVVPTVIAPFVVTTHPESALTEPSSTNVNAPPVTSAFASKSVARAGEAATT